MVGIAAGGGRGERPRIALEAFRVLYSPVVDHCELAYKDACEDLGPICRTPGPARRRSCFS